MNIQKSSVKSIESKFEMNVNKYTLKYLLVLKDIFLNNQNYFLRITNVRCQYEVLI